jgi:predicted amidophosphoribosyltransferase
MQQVLQRAFQGWAADVRPILELTQSTPADHESDDRLSYEELLAITRLNDPSGQAPRRVVVIVDDVLTSGKHFKVGQTLISAQYSGVEIRGLFLARCIHDTVATADEFPIVYTD